MPAKRIYHFQTPRTTPTNGLKKWLFLVVFEVRKGPPYEIWANRTNFYSSWENGEFFRGCALFHTQNEEKSPKISTCIRIHTHLRKYVMGGGADLPPPSRFRTYPCVYAYTGANFFWLFLILSVEEDTTLLTQKKITVFPGTQKVGPICLTFICGWYPYEPHRPPQKDTFSENYGRLMI